MYDERGRERRNVVDKEVELDEPWTVGREGDLPLGVDDELPDRGVSRQAVRATATAAGWQVEVTNSRGAWKHPWGLAAARAEDSELVSWPRVGYRVLGNVDGLLHWVLLESDALAIPNAGAARPGSELTDMAKPPKALTPPMEQALRTMFAAQLHWPPSLDSPLQLKQAARRLGVSEEAVRQRLHGAKLRALRLGLPPEVELTQAAYLHVLVEAGLLAKPDPAP